MSTLYELVNDISTSVNLSLILATAWVINNDYAVHTSTSLIIGQYSTNENSAWHQNDLIDAILSRATTSRQRKKEKQIKFLIEYVFHEKNGFKSKGEVFAEILDDDKIFCKTFVNKDKAIWFLDSLEAFESLEADLLDLGHNYKRNGYFCIIYTGTESDPMKSINIMLSRLFRIYVININVFLMVGTETQVYTYFPFNNVKCHAARAEYHLSFKDISENDEYEIKKILFPKKITNMHGCQLLVTTWDYPPYTMVDVNNRTGELIEFKGIEGKLVSLIAEKMNFTIHVNEPPTRDRGYYFKNGSTSGATNMVMRGETNLTVCCYMLEKGRVDVMLSSYSYLSLDLVVVIPAGSQMSPFERLVKPFKTIIWSCLCSSILLGILVIFIIRLLGRTYVTNFVLGANNRTPFTNLWSTLYGISVPSRLPRSNFARYLFVMWLLYALVIRTAYIGELYIILQDGRSRSTLSTLDEVTRQNFTLFTAPSLYKVLTEINMANIEFIDTEENTMEKLLKRLQSSNVKIAMTAPEPIIKIYNQQLLKYNQHINTLSETLMTAPITIYMRKHSYLIHRINELLLRIMSAGIVRKFEDYYLDKHTKFIRNEHQPADISLYLLLGLFTVYGVLMLLCILVFALELLSSKWRSLKMWLDFVNI